MNSKPFNNKMLAKKAGSKSSNAGKKHFSTQILEDLGKEAKTISGIYKLALKSQIQILELCFRGKRVMTADECRHFDALSKVTNKGMDKILPTLQHSDIDANTGFQITVVDATKNN